MSFVAGPVGSGPAYGGGGSGGSAYGDGGAHGGLMNRAGDGMYAGGGGGVCGDACGQACGDACGGGVDRYSQMGFVGSGGDYVPATYRYVGKGAGQYGLQESRVPRPCNWCCLLLVPCAVLSLLLLLPLLYYLLQPGTLTTTLPPPPPLPAATSPAYDCTMGTPEFWSGGKKLYCCEQLGNPAGCQEPVAMGSGDGPVAMGSGA